MPCIQMHSDWLYFPIPWYQVFCFTALQHAPIWTCHHWLFFPTYFLAEQMFCTCQKASIVGVSHRFVMWTKTSKLDPENMLGFGWLMRENRKQLSHLILPKGSETPKIIHFSLYKSTGKRSTMWPYLIFSACDATRGTNKAWFNTLLFPQKFILSSVICRKVLHNLQLHSSII